VENSTPALQKTLNRQAPNWHGDYVGTPTRVQTFITIRLFLFASSPPKHAKMRSDSASFLVPPSACSRDVALHRFLRSIRQMASFRARMCLFDHIPPIKTEILGQFLIKISAEKALTVAMLTCKLPVIVIVAHKSCIMNRHIIRSPLVWRVISDPYFTGREMGHVTYFWTLAPPTYLGNGWS